MRPPAARRRLPGVDALVAGVEAGDRAALAQAITRVESSRPEHRRDAAELLTRLLPRTGGALRVGLTGVPGVGKSTFIEALGTRLTARGHRVAVLAIDPTSALTGGSILGDKTRMTALSADPAAFIRPSPTSGTLGGVAGHTREALLLCEAAGYDVVIVETVGVGQSETQVAEMTDTFVALMLAGAGDALQGIKRGLMELCDVVVIHKADGDNRPAAERAAHEHRQALHHLRPTLPGWTPRVRLASALTGEGVDAVWQDIVDHRAALEAAGALGPRRARQQVGALWAQIDEHLRRRLRADARVLAALPAVEADVAAGRVAPTTAAEGLVETFLGG
ncbi:MAG: methylmalonyl Co-A mutase-associated GTPase MeaB [Myxococcales bacterium]|nr:methylmalonyl Co-A mutase-associated GTPase MeaB [Myxococcales bacterium]